jgi:hypothetical protein
MADNSMLDVSRTDMGCNGQSVRTSSDDRDVSNINHSFSA